MKAPVELASRMGYRRLLYQGFFCLWDRFPSVTGGRDQSALLWRGISVTAIFGILASVVALLMTWQAAVPLILFRTLAGLAFAALVGVVGSLSFGSSTGLSSGVLFGLTFPVGLVIAGFGNGAAFPLAFCLIIAATAGFGSGLASGVYLGAASGLAFAGAFTSMALMTASVEGADWFAWLGMLIAVPLVIFLVFWALLSLAYLPGWFLQRRVAVRSAGVHWGLSLVAIGFAGCIVGYALQLLSLGLWPNAFPPWAVATLFVVAYYRLPLWPLETLWAAISWRRLRAVEDVETLAGAIRRAYFDRSMLLPLPGEVSALRRLAERDFDLGVDEAIRTAVNSNHLLAAIAALQEYASFDPLRVHTHVRRVQRTPETGDLLLGYIGARLAPAAAHAWRAMDHVFKPNRRLAASTNMAALKASLDNLGRAAADLAQAHELDASLPSIEPVLAVYSSLLSLVKCQSLDQLAGYRKPAVPEDALRYLPDHLDAILFDLGELATTVRSYIEASSPITQRNALLRANEKLESITRSTALVPSTAGGVLVLGAMRWRQLLASAGGILAGEDFGTPFANPYVAGNPVSGELFVGREDIMRQLEALWADETHSPSVILYGHRRMGKTSILKNLGARFGGRTIVVDFNLQRVGPVSSTGELLHAFALALHDRLCEEGMGPLSEPVEERFVKHNPYTALNRYLDQVNRTRHGRRLVIAMDEFELIEAGIQRGSLQPELLAFWRGLIQTHAWIVIAFAGLHTLQEMTEDYWHPLFSSVTAFPVSYLPEEAARRLITRPTSDFSVDYDSEAVDLIVRLTNGQPYLLQHLGRTLITHLNRKLFEEGIERPRRLTAADVNEVSADPEFYRDASAYFAGVWQQAAQSAPAGQTRVLAALAGSEAGLDTETIAARAGLSPADASEALNGLKRHDVVDLRDGCWRFSVSLMQLWLLRQRVAG